MAEPSDPDSAYCARCRRANPDAIDGGIPTYWEVLTDADGEVLGVICEGCITGEEQQAMDEADMAFGAQMHDEGRILTGHCARCLKSVPYETDDPGEALPHGWTIPDHDDDVLLVVCPDCICPDDDQ